MAPSLTDWRGPTTAARAPSCARASTAEVAAVVRACAARRRPDRRRRAAIPARCGGATPTAAGDAVVLSLARMTRVREIDRDNATLTVEAGATLAAVQQAAADAGMLFPLSLAAEGSCTIGGNAVDERRRHRGAPLRQHARAGPRRRGGARRRARVGRPARPAQGQHRLRPQAALHRRRGHAGHRDRRGAEALPRAPGPRDGAGRRGRGRRRGRPAARTARGARRSPRRLRADVRADDRAVAPAPAGAARPAARPPLVRAGAGRRVHGRRPARGAGRGRRSRPRWSRAPRATR